MTDIEAHEKIGELKARCMILEARMAALTAFSCAILEHHPSRDILQTQWAKHLGPALQEFSGLSQEETNFAASVPAWIQHHLDNK